MKSFKLWMTFVIVISMIWGFIQWRESPGDVVLSNGTRFEWTSCWFKVPFDEISKRVRCGYLYPSSTIRLPVVVIKQPIWNRKGGPILYLAGGPGYPTGLNQESIEYWLMWLELNDWPHDLVLFDQRGIGLSQPSFDCPEIMSLTQDILGQSLPLEKEFSLGKAAIEQCYQRLTETHIDLSQYTTTHNSRDVADLMAALGGNDWNLYGASYGTRLALSVIRDYPQRVRSVILDSVYPPEINELLEIPFIYDNALTTLFEGCRSDKICHSKFPNLEDSFQTLLARLSQAPIEFRVSAPDSEKPVKVMINDHRLMDVIFQALYRWDFISQLPLAIDSARRGVYGPLQPLVEDYVSWLLDTNFSDAVYFSVECHDHFPKTTREEYLAQVARFPNVSRFVKNHWDYNPCHFWKVGSVGEAFHKPVSSKIPTLFLSGEHDPVTPPLWAKNSASHFSHGYVFVFPGIGHGAVDSDECAPKLVKEFLHNPDKKPSNECLSSLTGADFLFETD
jgi:pimeloyl-ACP methyl ester carboxylesterase